MYSVLQCTVYYSVQCTTVYIVLQCTVYYSVQCTTVYSVLQCTVYYSLVYGFVQYNVRCNVHCTKFMPLPLTPNISLGGKLKGTAPKCNFK